MTTRERIANLFPAPDRIPERFRLKEPVIQREYLINGEIRTWNGPLQEVLSPVCTPGNPAPTPVKVGGYPLLTTKEAMEALDAAARAYDNGQGKWPTMPVAERIRCVEDFAWHMKEQREDVVKLLMWEIGKNLKD